jgi:hypothetical protein
MESLLYAVGALFAIAAMLDLIARAAPAAVAQMPAVRAARNRYVEIQSKGQRALSELTALKQRRDELIDETMLFDARVRDAKRRAQSFAAGRTILVHELGRSAPERKLFEAYVVNMAIANPNRPISLERINPIYVEPQLIECWAESLVEARQLMDKTYPKEEGFDVELIGQTVEAVLVKQKS